MSYTRLSTAILNYKSKVALVNFVKVLIQHNRKGIIARSLNRRVVHLDKFLKKI